MAGHDGVGFIAAAGGEMRTTANEIWSAGNNGAYLTLYTTADGALASSERMRIADDGMVGIGSTSPTERLTLKDAGAHTVPVLSLETTGTSGAKIEVHVGTQNPDTVVTGDPGDLYVRDSTTNSTVYVNNGSGASNTVWADLAGGSATVPEETASEGWPVQPVTNTALLNSYRTDNNFHGSIYYTPHDITCTHMIVRTGIGGSGSVRHIVFQASDATILDGNMDKIFQVDVSWSGSGTKSTSLGATYVIKAGYYALVYGHVSGSNWYQDLYNTSAYNLLNNNLSSDTAPLEFTTSISASTSPTTLNMHTQATAANTNRRTPIHRFKTV